MDIKIGDKVQLKEAASLGTMQIMIVADILQREQIRAIYWCEPQQQYLTLEGHYSIFTKIA